MTSSKTLSSFRCGWWRLLPQVVQSCGELAPARQPEARAADGPFPDGPASPSQCQQDRQSCIPAPFI